MTSFRLTALFVVACKSYDCDNKNIDLYYIVVIIGSLATSNLWEISLQEKVLFLLVLVVDINISFQPSPKSRFFVLSNWNQGGGVYKESVSSPFPASQVSNIMLKTMGILRVISY